MPNEANFTSEFRKPLQTARYSGTSRGGCHLAGPLRVWRGQTSRISFGDGESDGKKERFSILFKNLKRKIDKLEERVDALKKKYEEDDDDDYDDDDEYEADDEEEGEEGEGEQEEEEKEVKQEDNADEWKEFEVIHLK